MSRTNKIINNVVQGEIAPELHGRVNLELYDKSVAKMENFIALSQGGVKYRPGTIFVNYTNGNLPGILIPFKFSDQQAYIIEATNLKFRFFTQNGAVLEANKTITAITQANPGVITSNGHGFNNGDMVFVNSIVGPKSLNSLFYLVANKTANTFTLTDVFGALISTADLANYVSGGTAARVYSIVSPYAAADLAGLQWAQSADTLYITHQLYKPRKLVRTTNISWAISKQNRTGTDPFTNNTDGDGNCPRAVTFTSDSRLMFGGTINQPEGIWGSSQPSSASGGNTAFDDFTLGVNDTNSISFTLANPHGEIDTIEWFTNTSLFMIIGTYGSIRIFSGGSAGQAPNPTSVSAQYVTDQGTTSIIPMATGVNALYIQRSQSTIRSLEFDLLQNFYITPDKTLTVPHLMAPGIIQMTYQRGVPNTIWLVRTDNRLLGITYEQKENVFGFHRHYIGGSSLASDGTNQPIAKVLSLQVIPRNQHQDQLWFLNERVINGHTVRSIEYLSDWINYPYLQDFYTGDQQADLEWYGNVLYEAQKQACHLDMCLGFNEPGTIDISGISLISSGGGAGGPDGFHIVDGELLPGAVLGQYVAFAPSAMQNYVAIPIFAWDNAGNVAVIGPLQADCGGLIVDAVNNVMYASGLMDSGGADNSDLVMSTAKLFPGESISGLWAPPASVEYTPYSGAGDLPPFSCQSMALSPDHQFVYVAGTSTNDWTDMTLFKFNAISGALVAVSAPIATGDTPQALFLTPDGTRLIMFGMNGDIVVGQYDANSLATLYSDTFANTFEIIQAAMSPDGTKIAFTDSHDGINVYCSMYDIASHSITNTFVSGPNNGFPVIYNGAITFPKGDSQHVLIYSEHTLLLYTLTGVLVKTFAFAPDADDGVIGMNTEPNSGLIFGTTYRTPYDYNVNLFVYDISGDGELVTESKVGEGFSGDVPVITFASFGGAGGGGFSAIPNQMGAGVDTGYPPNNQAGYGVGTPFGEGVPFGGGVPFGPGAPFGGGTDIGGGGS